MADYTLQKKKIVNLKTKKKKKTTIQNETQDKKRI